MEKSAQFGEDNKEDEIEVDHIKWKLVEECPHLHVQNKLCNTKLGVSEN